MGGIYDEKAHKVYAVCKPETKRDKREYQRNSLGGQIKVIKYYDKLDYIMRIVSLKITSNI